jgi:hypothetical protein
LKYDAEFQVRTFSMLIKTGIKNRALMFVNNFVTLPTIK